MSRPPAAQGAPSALAALVLLVACERAPLPDTCPTLAPGALVVTELRGPQGDREDPFGEWIEIFNASGAPVDLAGLAVEVRKLDGSGEARLAIRSHAELAPEGYGVLGRFASGAEPGHVDYGYAADFDEELYASAGLDVLACDVLVDRVIYRGLTDFGTLTLDGAIDPPSAAANDDEAAFCIDDELDDQQPSAGVRGTPGEPNPPCD